MNRQSHHELLLNGATELGLSLTELQKEKLLTYVHYIEKWNRVYNLTAITSTEGIINKHILDALTLIGRIDLKQKNILDVGSGAGIPGLILAIMESSCAVTCVDAVLKKSNFIDYVARQLGLKNVCAKHGRIESLSPTNAQIIVSRAFSSLETLVALTERHLSNDGIWVAMKGQRNEEEERAVVSNVQVFHVEQIEFPLAFAENVRHRHLVFMKRV